jgi:hypothetical protein
LELSQHEAASKPVLTGLLKQKNPKPMKTLKYYSNFHQKK